MNETINLVIEKLPLFEKVGDTFFFKAPIVDIGSNKLPIWFYSKIDPAFNTIGWLHLFSSVKKTLYADCLYSEDMINYIKVLEASCKDLNDIRIEKMNYWVDNDSSSFLSAFSNEITIINNVEHILYNGFFFTEPDLYYILLMKRFVIEHFGIL